VYSDWPRESLCQSVDELKNGRRTTRLLGLVHRHGGDVEVLSHS